jgi:hypothetical protein
MNDRFNLPQGITSVDTHFAGAMFYEVGGPLFQVNDVFKFPALSLDEIDKTNVFAEVFTDMKVGTPMQTRKGHTGSNPIINGNPTPSALKSTFTGDLAFFSDYNYIPVNWGGGGEEYLNVIHHFNDGVTPNEIDAVAPGGVATMPAFAVPGYEISWYDDPTFSGVPYDYDTLVNADIDIYAKYTAKAYKVYYDTKGGTGSFTNPQTVTWGGIVALPEVTKANCTFGGWEKIDPAPTMAGITNGQYKDYAANDNIMGITLSAIWSENAPPAEEEDVPGLIVDAPNDPNNPNNDDGDNESTDADDSRNDDDESNGGEEDGGTASGDAPITGDTTPIVLLLTICGAAAFGLIVCFVLFPKRRKKNVRDKKYMNVK